MMLRRAAAPRRGVVLLAVLVVLVLLTLAAYRYNELMTAEFRAVDAYSRAAQARALADSGVDFTAGLMADSTAFSGYLNGNYYDNPSVFQDVLVSPSDNPLRQGRFSVLSIRDPDDPLLPTQPYRFGLRDEAGKLNLNALLQLAPSDTVRLNMLMQLPNMTSDVANSILDWLDGSSTTPRSGGAKDEYYGALSPAYHCKNGPLDSLDELLLVKGVTPQLLYGNDRNRNGVLDPDEDDGSGQVDLGWQSYLTVYSHEPNVDSTGQPRIYINDSDLNTLNANLTSAVGDQLATFIIAFRLYGGSGGSTATAPGGATATTDRDSGAALKAPLRAAPADLQSVTAQVASDRAKGGGGRNKVGSLSDLITKSVSVPVTNGRQTTTVTLPSPLADPSQQQTLLPLVFDKLTTTTQSDLPARINVLTAPQAVLQMLPGPLSDGQIQDILDARPDPSAATPPDPIFTTPAWLITQASLPASQLSAIESYITSRSQVYRFQAVGYFDGGGPTARVEAVIDGNYGRPRIVYRRELTELGRGFTFPLTSGQ